MATPNTTKLPIAVEHHSHLSLPFDHATTSMFMLLQPMFYRHMQKTEKIRLTSTSVVRPNPIVCPTFGRVRQNLRAFFVPYRLVFPNWEEFTNDVVASNYSNSSLVSSVPYFTGEDIVNVFIGGSYSTIVTTPSTEPYGNYDFIYNSTYYKLTRFGRNAYKVLLSLGYDLVGSSKTFKFNGLALLAYVKIYLDWYTNSQYLDSALVLALERVLKYNDPTGALHLSTSILQQIFTLIRPAQYKSNVYFESAWDNPVSPNSGQYTAFSFADPTDIGSNVNVLTNSMGTPYMSQPSAGQHIGTTYMHQALQKLSEYQKRHALSGARSIDRVLTAFGIQTDYLRQQRSIYCGFQSIDVDIQSIYATAAGQNATEQSNVGDYAGAGFGNGSKSWDFQTDEEGIFIIISTIQPSGGYFQGYDRCNRWLNKFDFFQAPADSLGVQIIEKGEVYVSRNLDTFAGSPDDYMTKYGFTGRYGELKRSINRVTGDFALPSVLAGGNSWHLMREFNDAYFNNSVNNVVHSEDFTIGTDAEQFMRLFTYTEYDIDPFNVFLHVECDSYAPMRPLTDTFEFDSDAPNITIENNGAKVN